MEQWRNMAATLAERNFSSINMMSAAVEVIGTTEMKFALAAEDARRIRLGLPCLTDYDVSPLGIRPAVFLDLAVYWDTRLSEAHAGYGHVFFLCATRIGLPGMEPFWWQKWEGHHADAAAHADTALQRLRSAASHAAAASDVLFCMLETLPRESPLRIAWGLVSDQLLRRTTDELAMAREAVERMRPAVVAEFSDAWMLMQ